jgi:hypothetical protein
MNFQYKGVPRMNIVNRSLGAIVFGLVVSFGASAQEQGESSAAKLVMPEGSTVTVTRDGVTTMGVDGQQLEADDMLLFSEGSEASVVFSPCDKDQSLTLSELYTVPDTSPCAAFWTNGKLVLAGTTVLAVVLAVTNESDSNTSSP